MQLRKLGGSDLEVSVLGLGCANFGRMTDLTQSRAVVHAALDSGINFFDTAVNYGKGFESGRSPADEDTSEHYLGTALKGRRHEVVIATKFGARGFDLGDGSGVDRKGSRAYIRHAIETSLRRLQTDYVDLYQIHFPDPSTPIDETLAALVELIDEGKVRFLGHSNFSAAQIAEAADAANRMECQRFKSTQIEWSLLDRRCEADVIPAAARAGISVLPYFPLAHGLLTGKVAPGQEPPPGSRLSIARHLMPEAKLKQVEELRKWATSRGRSLLDISLGWLIGQPTCGSVLTGATSANQIRANAAATESRLSAAEIRELGELFMATG
ncbi:aldo/keto reductase [Nonomuraea fuscirosea]|uniref:aldo/keto reductase n=1 Tax=Nonomuraea fuscirosea TaxID=1291556 RepID=UPI00342A5639